MNPEVFVSPCHSRKTDFTVYLTAQVDPEEDAPVPDGMVCLTLPEQRYAVFTHVGPMSKVQDTYRAVFAWLVRNGLEQDKNALWLEALRPALQPRRRRAHARGSRLRHLHGREIENGPVPVKWDRPALAPRARGH